MTEKAQLIAELRHWVETEGFRVRDFLLLAPRARTPARERRRRTIAHCMACYGLTAHDLVELPAGAGATSGGDDSAPKMESKKMDMSQYAGGQFLKVADVKAVGPFKVTIVAVEVGKFKRPNVTFSDGRILSLGKNNVGKLISAYGAESDDWLQRQVELTVDEIEIDSEMKEAIIVKPISPPPENKAPVKPQKKRGNAGGNNRDDLDDSIPF
jgi:hypothetical protein